MGPDPPWEGAILKGKGRPIVKYRDTLRSSAQQELSSSWDGRPFGHNRHGPKSGGCCAPFRGAVGLDPHLT